MLKSIGIKNFRSLKNTCIGEKEVVDLKPLTMLLGKNSSGKSSFLRLFPLLKQSVSARTRGVLSFFGDEVDFGDFDTTVSHEKGDKQNEFIEFDFCGSLDKFSNSYSYLSRRIESSKGIEKVLVPYEVNIRIQFDKKQDISYISLFSLKIYGNTITFSLNKEGDVKTFFVNKKNYIKELENIRVHYGLRRLGFPYFVEGYDNESLSGPFCKLIKEENGNLDHIVFFEIEPFLECSLDTKENMRKYFSKKRTSSKKKSHEILKRVVGDDGLFDEFYDKFILFRFEGLYESVINDLCEIFLNVSYSKPLRANADRYYRNRFLSANELNSDGSNLVDYFVNLSESQQKDLENWLKENFGFWYSIEKSEGHKSIYIHEKDDVMHNITDMGFGFSQILPVVTQLWGLIKNKKPQRNYRVPKINYIYAIEQPELHLHPAMQCKLFNSIAKVINVAKQQNLEINFVIETHSETIINQIGRLIRKNEKNKERKDGISKEDVSVLIFSKNTPDSFTEIHSSPFDEKGLLTQWPIGFFGEDD